MYKNLSNKNNNDTIKQTQASTTRRLERSRTTILYGWLIAMIGIVCYCFAMLSNETSIDPYSSIFERGLMGWAALLLMLVGVCLWFMGSFTFLQMSEQFDGSDNTADD